jgi:DNA polymerase III subunit delta'
VNPLGIIGHAQILEQLAQLEGRPAFLLAGVPRLGKHKLAHWLTARVNCSSNAEKPCGICPSCTALLREAHPDLLEVGPKLETGSGKTARRAIIPIKAVKASRDDGHDFEIHVLEWLAIGPHYRRKVVIVDGAEFLNAEAANALLKVVEEPPHNALFIFLTRDPLEVIPTIVSRCTRLSIPPVSEGEMNAALTLLEGAEDPELLAYAAGRPGVLLERDAARAALSDAHTLLEGLETGMFEGMNAADALEKKFDPRWHPEALGFVARKYNSRVRLKLDEALLDAQERLEQYANAGLVFGVLALEWRRVLGYARA